MDDAFAEGGFAENRGFFVIFERAGDNFGGGSGAAVDEDDGWDVGEFRLAAVGVSRVVGDTVIFLNEDDVSVNPEGEEIFRSGDISAAVVAEIEDDFLDIMFREFVGDYFLDKSAGVTVEAGDGNNGGRAVVPCRSKDFSSPSRTTVSLTVVPAAPRSFEAITSEPSA